MIKHLTIGAALGALMVSGALAQSSSTPSDSRASPPAVAQSTSGGGAMAGQAQFIASQKPDQLLATRFKGTNVLGADNEKIGDISDILFDKSGKIEAYVVSVGGFLGMGAKEVAMAPSSFETVPGDNGGAPKLKDIDDQGPAHQRAGLRALRGAAAGGNHRHRCRWRHGHAALEPGRSINARQVA